MDSEAVLVFWLATALVAAAILVALAPTEGKHRLPWRRWEGRTDEGDTPKEAGCRGMGVAGDPAGAGRSDLVGSYVRSCAQRVGLRHRRK